MPDAAALSAPRRVAGGWQGVRRRAWRHPEWWALAISAAAWVALAAMGVHRGGAAWTVGHAAAMGAAMMLPLAVPELRFVALGSLWRRRDRAMAMFAAGFLAVWTACGALILVAMHALVSWAGWPLAAGAAVSGAALWELAPAKSYLLRRCRRTVPLAPRGWHADACCARYGGITGWGCLTTCGPLMVVCAAFAHSLPVMVVLFGVQIDGRYGTRRSPRLAAGALVGACLLAALAGGNAHPALHARTTPAPHHAPAR